MSFRRRTAWLLFLGLLAVVLHGLAGTGLVRASASTGSGDSFVAEVCTSHGLSRLDPAQTRGDSSQPASGAHDCCKLCATGGPLLTADLAPGVAPAPAVATPHDPPPVARPTLAVRTAHRPRGPPARA